MYNVQAPVCEVRQHRTETDACAERGAFIHSRCPALITPAAEQAAAAAAGRDKGICIIEGEMTNNSRIAYKA